MSAKLSDVVLCSLNPEQSGRLLKNLHFLSTAFSADACTAKITHKSDPQGFVQVSTKVARGCEVLKLSCEFGNACVFRLYEGVKSVTSSFFGAIDSLKQPSIQRTFS